MQCKKCQGRGEVDNPKYWDAKVRYNTDYYLSFEVNLKCKACNGSGHIIGNISEVLACLKSISNRAGLDKDDLFDIKSCIKLLEQ